MAEKLSKRQMEVLTALRENDPELVSYLQSTPPSSENPELGVHGAGKGAHAPKEGDGEVPAFPKLPGGGGGGAGGGGGGGRGGGGGKEPPIDPLIPTGERLYFDLWGQKAPDGYVEKLVKAGLNLHEIELNERKKPAFKLSKRYIDEESQFAARLSQIFGTR